MSTITFKEHAKATLLVLALIAIIATISILFCSSTAKAQTVLTDSLVIASNQRVYPDSITLWWPTETVDNTIVKQQCTLPDSIMLRINDFKYYWGDDIRNEDNHEWIVETAFNNDVDYAHVTQAMFNKRYGTHTIEYWSKHTRPLYHH